MVIKNKTITNIRIWRVSEEPPTFLKKKRVNIQCHGKHRKWVEIKSI